MAQTVDDLVEALEDADDTTREEAAKALADLADPTTLDALQQACTDDYWSVRSYAASGVAKIGGARALDCLVDLFNDPIMEVRNAVVGAVTGVGNSALERLLKCLKDERWRLREHAAKACGEIRDARAVDALVIVCRDRDGAVKSAAAEALGKIGDPKAIPALGKLFRDSSKTVRETAGTALVAIGEASIEALIESLQDKDFVVRCPGRSKAPGLAERLVDSEVVGLTGVHCQLIFKRGLPTKRSQRIEDDFAEGICGGQAAGGEGEDTLPFGLDLRGLGIVDKRHERLDGGIADEDQ